MSTCMKRCSDWILIKKNACKLKDSGVELKVKTDDIQCAHMQLMMSTGPGKPDGRKSRHLC